MTSRCFVMFRGFNLSKIAWCDIKLQTSYYSFYPLPDEENPSRLWHFQISLRPVASLSWRTILLVFQVTRCDSNGDSLCATKCDATFIIHVIMDHWSIITWIINVASHFVAHSEFPFTALFSVYCPPNFKYVMPNYLAQPTSDFFNFGPALVLSKA